MPTIKVRASGKVAENLTPEVKIVCRNSDYKVEFEFDEPWKTHDLKTALFVYNGASVPVPFSGNVCEMPELYNTTLCAIGVFAGDLITTTPAYVDCLKAISDLGGEIPPPTEDVYNKLVQMIESGMLKGEKGEKGDKGEKGIQGEQGIQGATGAKLISQELVGQDENGGNIYQQTFDDGTVAYFTAPRGAQGEASTEEGESFLTKTEADETYLPQPDNFSLSHPVSYLSFYGTDGNGKMKTYSWFFGSHGLYAYGSTLMVAAPSEKIIEAQTDNYQGITSARLSYAIVIGLTENKITLTDTQKEAVQTWLGVKKYYKHHLNFYKAGFSSFTLEFISSEATAYTNGGTAINEGLVGLNAKTIFLYNVYDPTGDNSGQAGFVVGSVAGYSNSDTDNGVYLSGAWSTNAGGAVKSIFDKIAIPFTSDTVTEI